MRLAYIVSIPVLLSGACSHSVDVDESTGDSAPRAHATMNSAHGAAAGAPAAPSASHSGSAGAAASEAEPSTLSPSGLPDVVFGMQVKVPAGAERLMCIYGAMPTERGVIAVPSAESHYTPGSHHLLAYRSDLTSIPDDQTGVWDCQDGSWATHQRGSYYEAQTPNAARSLPAGIAHKFQPGEVIILQAHYVNTTMRDIDASVELKLHTIDPDKVEYEAGSIMFNNGFLNLPPHEKTRATLSCPIPNDIQLALLWSHMHRQGIHFTATTDDAAAASALGTLYEEDSWDEPTPREYPNDPSVMLHAGSRITFSCDYDNPRDETLRFGNSAEKNEMCLLHGMYWPRMPLASELCFGGSNSSSPL